MLSTKGKSDTAVRPLPTCPTQRAYTSPYKACNTAGNEFPKTKGIVLTFVSEPDTLGERVHGTWPSTAVSAKAANARQSDLATQAPKPPTAGYEQHDAGKAAGGVFKSRRHTRSAVRQLSDQYRLRHLESACCFLQPSPTGACRWGCEGTQYSSFIAAILLAIAIPLFLSECGVSSATPSVAKT